MSLPPCIQQTLDRNRARYQIHSHSPTDNLQEALLATNLPARQLIRAVLLTQDDERLLVVLPADHLINFQALHRATGKHWTPANRVQCTARFEDCESGTTPPLGNTYGLASIIDDSILSFSTVCFEPGRHDTLLSMGVEVFRGISAEAEFLPISQPLSILESRHINDFTLPGQAERTLPILELQPRQNIDATLANINQLPTMPNMAQRLLRLRNDPNATVQDLTEIIQADPSLSAQIIRYARSAFFSYKGKVDTLDQAIGRVLGFETVLNMSLGLAASRTFHNPADGPLGLQAFWQHATYSAALAQNLANRIKGYLPINPGIAYLAGLLHNFGYLLAGHLFRGEFFLLNKMVSANPHVPIRLIERQILGTEHTAMGACLMTAWDMPEPIIATLKEHHNELYNGEHSLYVELIFLVDQLLRQHGIGDGLEAEPSPLILNNLGLDRATVEEITLNILDAREGLDSIARQLAA